MTNEDWLRIISESTKALTIPAGEKAIKYPNSLKENLLIYSDWLLDQGNTSRSQAVQRLVDANKMPKVGIEKSKVGYRNKEWVRIESWDWSTEDWEPWNSSCGFCCLPHEVFLLLPFNEEDCHGPYPYIMSMDHKSCDHPKSQNIWMTYKLKELAWEACFSTYEKCLEEALIK